MERALREAVELGRDVLGQGAVATYIPELAKADPSALAAAYCGIDGNTISAGDKGTKITVQSISKVASLGLALKICGENTVFSRVGVEPSADPFNSIMRLEMRAPHRPQNPLINSGAILVLSLLPFSDSTERLEAVLDTMRRMSGNEGLRVNEAVAASERDTSDRNRSLGYFLRSVEAMDGDVENILDSYFRQCAIECSVEDLAAMGATLACGGVNPLTGEQVFSERTALILRALMMTCGLYDGSGDFAVRVGFPAKSGVGGGIMGSVPARAGVAVLGPALDKRGNSIGGVRTLEMLSESLFLRVL
ncbi:MAG: glutaminase A [Thermovirgaceae bacterium]|jgi:glutaminase|nr:glutaminase A [Synergistales bacterium]MDI9391670.1 glutaminase A [Synergistota bacterium]MDY0179584.1 glutaminase A [Synergistaceae bacterium]HRW86917.1 glutaminase A [Thermovirgaceae bacterium]MDD3133209.1 glutaminase A [Synergistales bacterium]